MLFGRRESVREIFPAWPRGKGNFQRICLSKVTPPDLSLDIIKKPLPLLESRETFEIFSLLLIIPLLSLINSFEILLYFLKISVREETCFCILFVALGMILLNLGALIQFSLTGYIEGYQLSSSSAITEGFSTTSLFIICIFKLVKDLFKLGLFIIRGFRGLLEHVPTVSRGAG